MRSMKDWRLVARAVGLQIPDEELERVAKSLDGLETVFRPLTAQLHPGVDEAVIFVAPREKPE